MIIIIIVIVILVTVIAIVIATVIVAVIVEGTSPDAPGGERGRRGGLCEPV